MKSHSIAGKLLLPVIGLGVCLSPSSSAQLQEWSALNSHVEIAAGSLRQTYKEKSTSRNEPVAVLNREDGTLGSLQLLANWQDKSGGYIQAKYNRGEGTTSYSGYIQTGLNRVPFDSATHNLVTDIKLRMGMSLNQINTIDMNSGNRIQSLLFGYFGTRKWERTLKQYEESYFFRTYGAGLTTQYQPTRQTLIELTTIVGKVGKGRVNAPGHALN